MTISRNEQRAIEGKVEDRSETPEKQLSPEAAYFEKIQDRRREFINKLKNDKVFVYQSGQLRKEMLDLKTSNPDIFHKVIVRGRISPLALAVNSRRMKELFRGIHNARIKELLNSYVAFVSRFGVKMTLSKGKLKIMPSTPPESRFHVKLEDGRLFRAEGAERKDIGWLVYDNLYDAPDLKQATDSPESVFPPALEQLLQQSKAIVLRIDEEFESSILSDVEGFAYDGDKLTFIVHNSNRGAHLLCLIGEKVKTDDVWRKAATIVNGFQKKLYKREKAGRPPDMQRLGIAHK